MASRFIIKQAAHLVNQSGVIAYPTESVYGLGCNPFNEDAVFRLLLLKQRPLEKGLIILASDIEQLSSLIDPLDNEQIKTIHSATQATTWIVPARQAPEWLTGKHHSLAIRITSHPIAKALCSALGYPLVSTSANPSAKPPAMTPLRVRQYFKNQLDLVIHGKNGPLTRPTTIIDLISGKIIRK